MIAERWSIERAHAWHLKQPWLVGCNFTPSYAINQLEMWQAASFDLTAIDTELGYAASIGMNSVRVYLHDLLYAEDPQRFIQRVEAFLHTASKYGIRTMLVLFDSCWGPAPALGLQPQPRAGIHNSGWVQSPGMKALADISQHQRLQDYVSGIVGRFAKDKRVLAWDIWNEPDNGPEVALCDPAVLASKAGLVVPLLIEAFDWAKRQSPIQPLTSGIWLGDWSAPELLSPIQIVQTSYSDVVSFHNYGVAEDFEQRIGWLEALGRPLLCTEFMARSCGSTFEAILPAAKQHNVGAFCWGLVKGKTQTHLPWDSADGAAADPSSPWFHDIFDADGTPHNPEEVAFIRMITETRPLRLAA